MGKRKSHRTQETKETYETEDAEKVSQIPKAPPQSYEISKQLLGIWDLLSVLQVVQPL